MSSRFVSTSDCVWPTGSAICMDCRTEFQTSASTDQGIMSVSADRTLSNLNEELARRAEQLQAANNALAQQEQRLGFVVSELRRNKAHLAEAQKLGRMGSVGV